MRTGRGRGRLDGGFLLRSTPNISCHSYFWRVVSNEGTAPRQARLSISALRVGKGATMFAGLPQVSWETDVLILIGLLPLVSSCLACFLGHFLLLQQMHGDGEGDARTGTVMPEGTGTVMLGAPVL